MGVENIEPYRPKIVLVDDEPALLRLTRRRIESFLDSDIYTASNGVEGLRLLKEFAENGQYPDLCITDLVMPNMDGAQMIRQAKSRGYDSVFPWIVASGTPGDIDVDELKPFAVLQKPYVLKDLQSTVKKALECSPNYQKHNLPYQ